MIAKYAASARNLLLGGLIIHCQLLGAANYKPIVPAPVQACVSRQEVAIQLKLEVNTNPYYLRGDFDGDGRPDYAVSVLGRKTQKAGVALCHASGHVTVLGGDEDRRTKFSDMPGDQFLSSDWNVITKQDAIQRTSKLRLDRRPVGEAILMPWDDGEGLVYFDGVTYRWITLRRADRL